ncbi:MAG: hypothetical protein KDC56_12675, partial [Flavobacteriaceae bacterium]|nr:hypothetical protein [Flavobacteriaceae bacterium]
KFVSLSDFLEYNGGKVYQNRIFVLKIILDTKFFQNFTRIDERYGIYKSKFTTGILFLNLYGKKISKNENNNFCQRAFLNMRFG